MLEKLYNVITGKGLEMRERLFRLIIISGIIMAVGGMLETIFFMDMTEIIVPVGVLFGGMIIVAVATFKYHKVEFSAVFIAVVLIAFVFPSMFFFCGGIDGGLLAEFSKSEYFIGNFVIGFFALGFLDKLLL